jgi:phage terminase large subunit
MESVINLLPKQSQAWECWESPTITELGYGGAAGGGKGVTLDTLVLTNSGWKKAKHITLKDKLVSIDGTYTKIKGIFPQGLKQTYTLTFDDGVSSTVDNTHLWKVWNSDHGKRDGWIIRDTETLYKSKGRFSIPLLEKPVQGSYIPKYDPYILGYILGDGTMTGTHPTIYTADEWTTRYLKNAGWKIYKYKESVWQCALPSKKEDLYSELPRKSKQNKRVPSNLLNGTPEVRLSVLQGLMDSDGTVQKDGSCSYSTVVDGLAEDVVYLVRSLGGKASIEVKKRIMPSGHTEKDVRVSHCGKFMPFRLPRKVSRVKKAVYDKRYISKIVKDKIQETICFSVGHKSHLFVIDGFVVTHNSRLGCYLAITIAEMYPGSRGAIGRKELKTLRLTTMTTLFEIFKELGYSESDYKYDAQQSVITFKNGSQIYFLDTAYSPQDPEYTRFGSLEITWAWIDESNETPEKAKSILKTRVGRKNKLNGKDIKPFWLETFNPNKGHVYRDYYKPFKEGTMPEYRAFIRALPGDNPHLSQSYITGLERSDKVTRERLLKGNFEFDDNPQKVMFYDAIQDLSTNTLLNNKNTKIIIADIARFGGDKIVIGVFKGLELYRLDVYTYQGIDETIRKIKEVSIEEAVGFQNIVVDEGGVGGGVVDGMRGIKGFNGASSPLPIWDFIKNRLIPANYQNFRSQCYFKLGEMVNNRQMLIEITSFTTNIEGYTKENAISDLFEELDAVKQTDNSTDGKKTIIPKSEIKEMLGRSPDFADIMMMRMFFELVSLPINHKETLRESFEEEKNPAI